MQSVRLQTEGHGSGSPPSSDETLELVSERHRGPSLGGSAVDAQRLGEGRRLHHAGFARLGAVVEPYAQRQDGLAAAAVGLRESGGDDNGLGHVHDVPGDHGASQEPLVTCWATRVCGQRRAGTHKSVHICEPVHAFPSGSSSAVARWVHARIVRSRDNPGSFMCI